MREIDVPISYDTCCVKEIATILLGRVTSIFVCCNILFDCYFLGNSVDSLSALIVVFDFGTIGNNFLFFLIFRCQMMWGTHQYKGYTTDQYFFQVYHDASILQKQTEILWLLWLKRGSNRIVKSFNGGNILKPNRLNSYLFINWTCFFTNGVIICKTINQNFIFNQRIYQNFRIVNWNRRKHKSDGSSLGGIFCFVCGRNFIFFGLLLKHIKIYPSESMAKII